MSEQVPIQTKLSILVDLSQVCLLFQRRRMQRINGLCTRKGFKDGSSLTVCGYALIMAILLTIYVLIKNVTYANKCQEVVKKVILLEVMLEFLNWMDNF